MAEKSEAGTKMRKTKKKYIFRSNPQTMSYIYRDAEVFTFGFAPRTKGKETILKKKATELAYSNKHQ